MLTFEHGEILCGKEDVVSVEIEGDMSDYVPANEDEREKLEQGFVRFKGRWMSKPAYKSELKRKAEKARERTEYFAEHSEFYNAWEKETERHAAAARITLPFEYVLLKGV